MTGHLARAARRIAAHQPGGRLDPPLTLALDECARIAPVPPLLATANIAAWRATLARPRPR